MPDVSKIEINSVAYDIKDATARQSISELNTLSVSYESESETIQFTNSNA